MKKAKGFKKVIRGVMMILVCIIALVSLILLTTINWENDNSMSLILPVGVICVIALISIVLLNRTYRIWGILYSMFTLALLILPIKHETKKKAVKHFNNYGIFKGLKLIYVSYRMKYGTYVVKFID